MSKTLCIDCEFSLCMYHFADIAQWRSLTTRNTVVGATRACVCVCAVDCLNATHSLFDILRLAAMESPGQWACDDFQAAKSMKHFFSKTEWIEQNCELIKWFRIRSDVDRLSMAATILKMGIPAEKNEKPMDYISSQISAVLYWRSNKSRCNLFVWLK